LLLWESCHWARENGFGRGDGIRGLHPTEALSNNFARYTLQRRAGRQRRPHRTVHLRRFAISFIDRPHRIRSSPMASNAILDPESLRVQSPKRLMAKNSATSESEAITAKLPCRSTLCEYGSGASKDSVTQRLAIETRKRYWELHLFAASNSERALFAATSRLDLEPRARADATRYRRLALAGPECRAPGK
jgi:hypothetical protein